MSRTELAQVMPWRERLPCNGTASRGYRLFEAHADQGLLQGKQLEQQLRYGKKFWGKFAGKQRKVYICRLHLTFEI